MRLLICAGGTGGGVFPALSILQAVAEQAESVLWVGGKGGMEAALISRQGIPYAEIQAAGLHGVGLAALPGNLLKLISGYFHSRRIIRKFHPDVILLTGGYLAFPVALAGIKNKILLYVPDIEPGLALRTLARFADVIALTAEKSKAFFNPRKTLIVTGYPTRPGLNNLSKKDARTFFELSENLPVLMVLGGSKGAHSINQAVLHHLSDLLEICQVIHVTGELDWETVKEQTKALDSQMASRYHPYPFLHEEIGPAFSSADLVVCRAGASTLGELPLFALPAVLVPYPFAWRYQKVNADYLVENGAAILLKNENLDLELLQTVIELLKAPEKRREMSHKMGSLAVPDAATKIADLLIGLGTTAAKKRETR